MNSIAMILLMFACLACGSAAQAGGDTPPSMFMKDLLKKAPAEDRREFEENLWLRDGRIVSSNHASLERTMNADSINEITSTLSRMERDKQMPPRRRPEIVAVKDIISDVPGKLRPEFLDNMMFRNLTIVSVYTGGLKKKMKDDKIKQLLKGIFPLGEAASGPKDKIQCAEGICHDAVCAENPPASGPPYVAKPGWASSATCGIF